MKKTLLLLFVSFLAITGCKNKLSKVAGMMGNENEGKARDAIVGIYNNVYPKVDHLIRQYSGVFDYEKGPQGNEENPENAFNLLDLKPDYSTSQEIENFKKAVSGDTLSKAGETYIKSYQDLSNTLEELKTYYKRGDYKDDKFAKGKQLHVNLRRQAEAYYTSQGKILEILEEIENKESLEEVTTAKENGEKGKEHFYQLVILSKELLTLSEKPIDKIDKAKFKTKVGAFEKTMNDLSMLVKSRKEEFKNDPYKTALIATLESYLRNSDDYYADVKSMNRYLESGDREVKPEQLKEDILSNYNRLIDSYNMVMSNKGYFEF